jgi:hypothetical protein
MKALKVMTVVLAVGLFSVTAFAQDTCDTAVAPGGLVNLCEQSVGLTDLAGNGGYDVCWGGYGLRDAWYVFTATDALMRLRTDLNSIETDTHFMVYGDGCAVQTDVGCSEDEVTAGWYGDICVPTTVDAEYHVQLGTYAVDHDGYGPSYNWCNYYTSLSFQLDVFAGGSVCGDQIIACDGSEDCEDGFDDGDCEFGCRDCACLPPPVPMLPAAGLVGLGVLLVTGGALVFGRRRK